MTKQNNTPEYDFDKIFDDSNVEKNFDETKVVTDANLRKQPNKRRIKQFTKQTFKHDPRKNFKIADCCANCVYSVFMTTSLRRGFCALATNRKFKLVYTDLILRVSSRNLRRNRAYAYMNWVKIHATNVCDAHRLDIDKLISTKKWIQKKM